MAKFYCFKCGFGTDYTYNKPKLCLKCGHRFADVSIATTVPKQAVIPPTKQAPKPISKPIISQPDIDLSIEEEEPFQETPIVTSFAEDIRVDKNFESFTFNKPTERNVKVRRNKKKVNE